MLKSAFCLFRVFRICFYREPLQSRTQLLHCSFIDCPFLEKSLDYYESIGYLRVNIILEYFIDLYGYVCGRVIKMSLKVKPYNSSLLTRFVILYTPNNLFGADNLHRINKYYMTDIFCRYYLWLVMARNKSKHPLLEL